MTKSIATRILPEQRRTVVNNNDDNITHIDIRKDPPPTMTPTTRANKKKRRRPASSSGYHLSAKDRQLVIALALLFVLFSSITIVAVWNVPDLPDDVMLSEEGVMVRVVGDNKKKNSLVKRKKKFLGGESSIHALQQQQKEKENTELYKLQHTFPVHVGDDMEDILHPGVQFSKHAQTLFGADTKLRVPKFWSPTEYGSDGIRAYLGNGGQRIMTPDEAASVGSFVQMGDDYLPTIVVSIASYCDLQCVPTVESIYDRAKHPERIRVVVVDQLISNDDEYRCDTPKLPCQDHPDQAICKYRHLMEFYKVDAKYSVGPVFARHLAYRMYRGEYFAMQVDSHVRFTQDWDEDIVGQWQAAKNEYGVLTVYLSDIKGSIHPLTHKNIRTTRPIMCDSGFEGEGVLRHIRHDQQPEEEPDVHGEPTLHPFWAAGFSFARGHFIVQVPYDQYLPLVFQGEEISLGLRGFTYGYDFYAPERSVCFHMYDIKLPEGQKVPKYWDHDADYEGCAETSMKRLNGIIGVGQPGDDYYHKEEDLYGVGRVRSLEKFFDTFGFHTDTGTVERHLCEFVGRPMMKVLQPHLRKDRMGIDFDKVTYQYVDPRPDEITPSSDEEEYEEEEDSNEEAEGSDEDKGSDEAENSDEEGDSD